MAYKLKNIIYETNNFWALRIKKGFEVYKKGVTHSTRCARIGWEGENGWIEPIKAITLAVKRHKGLTTTLQNNKGRF